METQDAMHACLEKPTSGRRRRQWASWITSQADTQNIPDHRSGKIAITRLPPISLGLTQLPANHTSQSGGVTVLESGKSLDVG